MLNTQHLAYMCPIRCIENNLFISKRGDVSLGFVIQQPPVFSMAPQDYEHMQQGWIHLLKKLTPGMLLHKQDIFYQQPYQAWENSPNYMKRMNKLYYLDRPVLHHKSYLFITIPLKDRGDMGPGDTFFAKATQIAQSDPTLLIRNIKGVDQLVEKVLALEESITTGLEAMKPMQYKRLTTEELALHLYQSLSLNFHESSPRKMNVQPMARDVHGIKTGKYHVRIMSLREEGAPLMSNGVPRMLPSDIFKSGIQGSDHIELPCSFVYPLSIGLLVPHILNIFIELKDTEKIIAQLKRFSNNLGAFIRAGDENALLKREAIQGFIASVYSGNHQVCQTGLNVVLFADQIPVLNHYTHATEQAFTSMNGATCFLEQENTGNLFFASLAGNGKDHYRGFVNVLEQAACYLPKEGHYLEDAKGILLVDRFGKPVVVDLWDQPQLIENRNKIIVGPSGSGKSFLMNHLVSESLYQGHHVVILDIGGSYKRCCALHGGQYYELSQEHPLSFTIFLCEQDAQGNWKPDQDKINFIATVLTTIWKGEAPLSKEAMTLLKEMIMAFFMKHKNLNTENNSSHIPNLTTFYEFVNTYQKALSPRESCFFDFDSFKLVLKPFVHDGEYAHLLNASSNLDLTHHPFIVFDLEGIKKDPTVYSVVSILIIELMLEKIKRLKGVKKSFVIDECWEIMRSNLQGFIAYMYRTIRKRQGEVYIATQGVEDIRDSPIGAAMVNNTDTFLILDHSKNTSAFPILQQTFGFTDQDIAILSSIDNSHRWNEVFIKMGILSKVYRLDVSPHTAAVYTSREEEIKPIEALREQFGGNLGFAINQYIENKYPLCPSGKEGQKNKD